MRGYRCWLLTVLALLGNVGCITFPKQQSSTGNLAEIPAVPGLSANAPVTAKKDLSQNESAQLCLEMAIQLEQDNKELDAIIYYEKARQLDEKYQDICSRRLAVLYDRVDEQARAMNEYQRLLAKIPNDSTLLNDLGYSYYNRGQWQQAEIYLQKSVKADRSNKRAWINLGMTLAQLDRNAEALEAFQQAVSRAEAHANLAFIMSAKGHIEDAIREYETALTLEPALRQARHALEKLKQTPQKPQSEVGQAINPAANTIANGLTTTRQK